MLERNLCSSPINASVGVTFKIPSENISETSLKEFTAQVNEHCNLKFEVNSFHPTSKNGGAIAHASDKNKKLYLHLAAGKIGIQDKRSNATADWFEENSFQVAHLFIQVFRPGTVEELTWRFLNRSEFKKKEFVPTDYFDFQLSTPAGSRNMSSFMVGMQYIDEASKLDTKILISEDPACVDCVDDGLSNVTFDVGTSANVDANELEAGLRKKLSECRQAASEYFVKFSKEKYRLI